MKPQFIRPLAIVSLLLTVTVLAQTAVKEEGAAVCTPASIQKNCEDLHNYYAGKFVTSVGFGYDRMPQVQEAISSKQWQIGLDSYVVKNIQLVSLLKHDPAVVYPPVTVMQEFNHHRNPPVAVKKDGQEPRALNDFEIAALKQLKEKKENMVVSGGTIMVGALRAEASCIKCHEVDPGALLGAFTYTLEKQSPVKTEQSQAAPVVPQDKLSAQR